MSFFSDLSVDEYKNPSTAKLFLFSVISGQLTDFGGFTVSKNMMLHIYESKF